MRTIVCQQCHAEVQRKKDRKFCSRTCATAAHVAFCARIRGACPVCNAPIPAGERKTHCSRRCANITAGANHYWAKPKWDDAFRQRVAELWETGMSTIAIGLAMTPRVSKNVIVSLAHRMHLPKRPSPLGRLGVADPYPDKRRPGRAPGSVNRPKRIVPALPALASVAAPVVVAVRKPPAPPAPRPAAPQPAPSPHRTCQWIEGPARDAQFCGKPTVRHSSWCSEHYDRVFIRRPRSEALELAAA